jgi:hypothetical protein
VTAPAEVGDGAIEVVVANLTGQRPDTIVRWDWFDFRSWGHFELDPIGYALQVRLSRLRATSMPGAPRLEIGLETTSDPNGGTVRRLAESISIQLAGPFDMNVFPNNGEFLRRAVEMHEAERYARVYARLFGFSESEATFDVTCRPKYAGAF